MRHTVTDPQEKSHSRLHSIPERDLTRFIRQESRRQAEQWRETKERLDLAKPVADDLIVRLEDDKVWETVGAACTKSRIENLAAALNMNPKAVAPHDILRAGVSTQETYNAAWEAAIKAAKGCTHERLLDVYKMERETNALVGHAVASSSIYLFGARLVDAKRMRDTWAARASCNPEAMTASPQEARMVATCNDAEEELVHVPVVMVFSATMAAGLGAEPAQYSMSSKATAPSAGEGLRQMVKFECAHKMQVYTGKVWPPELLDALWGVAPVVDPLPKTRKEIESMGVPTVMLTDMESVFERSEDNGKNGAEPARQSSG